MHHFAMATNEIIPALLEIGQRLELIREALGIEGKGEFADICGVEANTYSQWINGRANVSLPFALQIVKATGATLDYIYLGKTEGLPMKFMRITEQRGPGGDTPPKAVKRKKAG